MGLKRKLEPLAKRVRRVSKKIVHRQERRQERREARGDFRAMTRPLRRKQTPELARVLKGVKPIIAYDLETTSIKRGTPIPLYLTACGDGNFWFSGEVLGFKHLGEILAERFLLPELRGCRFVAWNGNNFDVYFIALALLRRPEYVLRPYMTRGRNLRGLRVTLRKYDPDTGVEITGRKGVKTDSWEFLDGIAMTGMTGKPLKDFLKTFAPDYMKLDAPDFDNENFNPRNPDHVRYAERDSEGLYKGMCKVRELVLQNFTIDLSATIGNMGIKIFQRHMPMGVECWKPPVRALRAIRDQVMRGGYCFCVQRYHGPVWKYDLNQAYAAAMREARLPAGRCVHQPNGRNKYADVYIARVRGRNPHNRVPFYYRDTETGRSVFALQEIGETWITSIEVEQLEREGWKLDILESWFWESRFRMKSYVDTLERLRIGTPESPRDPKDAQGEVMKMIGNNSYGKTVEQLEGLELVMAAEQPEGFHPYQPEDGAEFDYIWFRIGEPMLREYHQPQIGAFITAHVRMVVRRAALQNPDAWLYADTDCVMFRAPVKLDTDPRRYGAWKIEAEGAVYKIIAKKVYISGDGKTKHAKGMNVKRLRPEDFDRWLAGEAPRQLQLQRQNFVKVLSGFDMFIEREKVGEVIKQTEKAA